MNTRLTLLAALLLAGPALANAATPEELIRPIQDQWAEIKYRQATDKQVESYDKLAAQAHRLVESNPGVAEALIWEGIVLSSEAGAKGGLGALGLAKDARQRFEEALKLNEKALGGSAYTSLATLYAKVPGWPIGFGDNAADHADMTRVRRPLRGERSGKRLAVIGSGPAGMTCAYFSALFGHEVTVFEGSPALGGMPKIGIPDYRLPKYVVDKEVGLILELGILARINTLVGRDIDFDDLLNEYDACLIATGTWKEKTLDIPHVRGSMGGLSFLTRVKRGDPPPLGERVVVVGGGGVGFYCAFAAKRLGVSEVHIVCVEGQETMRITP